jgi:hypothetical protein
MKDAIGWREDVVAVDFAPHVGHELPTPDAFLTAMDMLIRAPGFTTSVQSSELMIWPGFWALRMK